MITVVKIYVKVYANARDLRTGKGTLKEAEVSSDEELKAAVANGFPVAHFSFVRKDKRVKRITYEEALALLTHRTPPKKMPRTKRPPAKK